MYVDIHVFVTEKCVSRIKRIRNLFTEWFVTRERSNDPFLVSIEN